MLVLHFEFGYALSSLTFIDWQISLTKATEPGAKE